MHPLYTYQEYISAKGNDLLPFRCKYCQKTYYKRKTELISNIKRKHNTNFCSFKCNGKFNRNRITVFCSNCGKETIRLKSVYKKSKSKRFFCSQSCSGTYNNTHKTNGCRRSKIEIWVEQQLTNLYPHLDILFNDKTTINSELDIYIPSLKLAIELNGIFHYEPIYGNNKLKQIQNNDNNKFQLCQQHNIGLCIIDISNLKYFKPDNAQKYLDIICNIINSTIAATRAGQGIEP